MKLMGSVEVRSLQRLALCTAAVLLYSATSADAVRACGCECCHVEEQREDQSEDVSRFECAYAPADTVFASASASKAPKCDALCMQSPTDSVLTATESQEIDTQRFCFFECEPRPPPGKTPSNGDLCGRFTKAEEKAVRDGSGNALPPMEVPKLASHFLAQRRKVTSISRVGAPAPGPAAGVEKWSSVSAPAKDQGARVTEWAEEATNAASEAEVDAEKAGQLANDAGSSIASVLATVQGAKDAAAEAHAAELKVREMRDNALYLARQAAFSTIPDMIKEAKKEAREKAEKDAKDAAAKAKKDMLAKVPAAAAAAAKPYTDTMNRAAAMAAEYQKRANDMTSQSTGFQLQAQMAQAQANQYIALGSMAEGQKLMQQSRQLMNLAVGLNGQAAGFYGTAGGILKTLPAYAKEAESASYHATMLLNPDAPPPPPPLV